MSWWHYLLLVNFYLVLFFGFYTLLLRKETFFQLNRIYLVAAAIFSFAIPLIQADWVKDLFITRKVQQTIYNTPINIYTYNITPTDELLTIGEALSALYIGVASILILKLMWELIILKREIEKPDPSVAYSFFKKISLGNNTDNHDVIAAHEHVHARQWHTIDVLIIESIVIINWFNPVVYLYRFAIKYIHEFIADNQVIQKGETDKADYAMLLLTQTFDVPSNHLVSNFYNHSLLKQRIIMLQKNKSKRIALAKYGLSAPLFVLMLILSSATVNNSKALKNITTKTQEVLLVPASSSIGMLTEGKDIGIAPSIMLPDTIKYTQQPSFPGGRAALEKYMSRNVVYPAMDREKNIQGKVSLQFAIESDGSVTDVVAISGPSQTLKDAAIVAMKNSPTWIPGYKDGKLVKMPFTYELNFTLGDEISNSVRVPVVDGGNNQVYTVLETQPKFSGGTQRFLQFLAANIKYPAEDRENNLQGRVVIQFVVEKDGSLTDVKVIRSPSIAMGEEAVRVASSSPKWIPGIQGGRAVRAQYTVPVNFTLGGNNSSDVVTEATFTRLRGVDPKDRPMILIDGVEASDASKLDQNSIESMTVLRSATATSLYGEKAKNGAIIVITKNGKNPKEETPAPSTKKQ